jgi:hypothetical protein
MCVRSDNVPWFIKVMVDWKDVIAACRGVAGDWMM